VLSLQRILDSPPNDSGITSRPAGMLPASLAAAKPPASRAVAGELELVRGGVRWSAVRPVDRAVVTLTLTV